MVVGSYNSEMCTVVGLQLPYICYRGSWLLVPTIQNWFATSEYLLTWLLKLNIIHGSWFMQFSNMQVSRLLVCVNPPFWIEFFWLESIRDPRSLLIVTCQSIVVTCQNKLLGLKKKKQEFHIFLIKRKSVSYVKKLEDQIN